ncbi:MAG: cation:dicarboxylase symporter family transporter, partial [Rhodospirillales bacterium]|nr:cation:dicarboxylase symporter family transporter [Rhodospirillales bacterium]
MSTTMTARPRWRRLAGDLSFQTFLGMVAGVALGILAPRAGTAMQPLATAFIALIRMMVGPIIFCTVVHGIAGMGDMRKVGRVAIKALIYFEIVTTLALVIGMAMVNLWRPGAGMNIDLGHINHAIGHHLAAKGAHNSPAIFLLSIVPRSFVGAFVTGQILQVLFVSVLFAAVLLAVGERGKPLLELIGTISKVLFRIIGFIMYTAPI